MPPGSRMVIPIDGLGYVRMRGSVALDDRSTTDDIEGAVRFFIFGAEPDSERLVRVAGPPPVPAPPRLKSVDEAGQRLYLQLFARKPNSQEARIVKKYFAGGKLAPAASGGSPVEFIAASRVSILVLASVRGRAGARRRVGGAVYQKHCAQCHDKGVGRAPQLLTLEPVDSRARSGGADHRQDGGAGKGADPRGSSLRGHVRHRRKSFGAEEAAQAGRRAPSLRPAFDKPFAGPYWNGWGVDASNRRMQPAAMAGLRADQVPQLKLKWAFGFPGASTGIRAAHRGGRTHLRRQRLGQSLFAGRRHRLHLLDVQSRHAGAQRHQHRTGGRRSGWPISATSMRKPMRWMPATGALLWKVRVEEHPAAMITGAPALYDGRLYVPTSSYEEVTGAAAKYECCKFRGSGDRAGCRHRQADLEELHHRGGAPSGAQEQAGHATLGTLRRGRVVVAHYRCEEARDLCDYRRRLLRPACAHQRCLPGLRYGHREDAVVAPDDRGRRLYRRLPHRGQLPGSQWTGLRFRLLAEPGGSAQRQARAGGRAEIRYGACARSGPAGRSVVERARGQGRSARRSAVGQRVGRPERLRGCLGPLRYQESERGWRDVRAETGDGRARLVHAAAGMRAS